MCRTWRDTGIECPSKRRVLELVQQMQAPL
jgi:hypothetical protein